MTIKINVGLIGAGFIGCSHALAINSVNRIFGSESFSATPAVLADADEKLAQQKAAQFGFEKWTVDWREAVDDCDAVIIAVPSFLHKEIALHAIDRGKAILCEKPVGLSHDEAQEIADAAGEAGVTHAVGFTYMRTPLIRYAKRLLEDGTMGAPLHFKGCHCEDFLASPDIPFSWRQDASLAGKAGALGDMGWHILAVARYFCGPIGSLSGSIQTFHQTRRLSDDPFEVRTVENDDWAGVSLRFETGAVGLIDVSRVAHGRKMHISFELVCERGTIAFNGERSNEIQVFVSGEDPAKAGFKTIHVNNHHPDYGDFIPAPGHGIGFNDLKTIELRDFLKAIVAGRTVAPDLDEACKIARVCAAIIESSSRNSWIEAPEKFGT